MLSFRCDVERGTVARGRMYGKIVAGCKASSPQGFHRNILICLYDEGVIKPLQCGPHVCMNRSCNRADRTDDVCGNVRSWVV